MLVKKSKKLGFTLMELMIAATIIIVALVGLLATYFVCFDANESAKNRARAVNDATIVFEEMRNRLSSPSSTFSDVTAENWTLWAQNAGLTTVGDPNSEMITVSYVNPFFSPLQVTLRIDWTERGGRQQFLELVTLMTKRQ